MATVGEAPMLAAALDYARLGYAVFPCRPGAKLPATGHGVLDATSDAAQITAWWRRWPQANIGLACNGLLVVDIDPGGLAWPGDDDKRQSIKGTSCPLQQTPRGGYHLVFGIPAGCHWRCSVGLLAPGVDTRTGGGYIVVAPSVVKGKTYQWIRPLVRKEELPPPPDWLIAELDAVEHKRQKSPPPGGHNGQTDVALLTEGTRNAGLASLAGKLRRAGLSQTELETALLAANQQRCRPPLPEREVLAIARSIGRYPPGPAETSWAMQQAWRHAIEHRMRKYATRRHF
jgi:hypothetical protein